MAVINDIIIAAGQSTDIHLFLTGLEEPGPAGTTGALTVGQTAEVTFALSDATGPRRLNGFKCEFITPPGTVAFPVPLATCSVTQPVVTDSIFKFKFEINPAANKAVGETFCRISYLSAANTLLTNVIFRVSVHSSLTRFWLGTKRLTLLNNDPANFPPDTGIESDSDSGQISVYAECDDNGVKRLANLTAQSYLTYTETLYIPTGKSTPQGQRGDVIKAQGTALLTASIAHFKDRFKALPADRPVRIADYAVTIGRTLPVVTPTTPAATTIYVVGGATEMQPVLRCVHQGTESSDDKRLKLLVLSEGFTNQADVDGWLTFLKSQLFSNAMHEPFNMLKESVDIWTADLLSYDPVPGITQMSPFTAQGYWVPTHPLQYVQLGTNPTLVDIDNPKNRSAFLTVKRLIELVGLPTPQSPTTLIQAKATWGSLIPANSIDANLFAAWYQQVPQYFGYDRDTVFALAKGTPQRTAASTTELSWGDWLLGSPNNVPSIQSILPSRLGSYSRDQPRLNALLRSFGSKAKTGATYSMTGTDWLQTSANQTAAGLICIITNDPTVGGASFSSPVEGSPLKLYYGSYFSAGGSARYDLQPTTGLPMTTVKLTPAPAANATPSAQLLGGISTLVHEVGHLLGLGDEYGNVYGSHPTGAVPAATGDPNVDRFANIITHQSLTATPNPIAIVSNMNDKQGKGIGKLVAPERLKWNWDRTELAARLLQDPIVVGSPALNASTVRLKLKLEYDTLQSWEAKLATVDPKKPVPPTRVILRPALLIHPVTGVLDPNELLLTTLKTAVTTLPKAKTATSAAVAGFVEIEVEGALPLQADGSNVKFVAIKKDDVVYVPRYYAATNKRPEEKMRLVAGAVAEALNNKSNGIFRVTLRPTANFCLQPSQKKQKPVAAIVAAMNTDLGRRNLTPNSFDEATLANTVNTGTTFSATPPAPPAGSRLDTFNIIGIYEGGGEYDCQVYRSNGYSKMRSATESYVNDPKVDIVPFNYVCQYFLVNRINPTKLAKLDTTYDQLSY